MNKENQAKFAALAEQQKIIRELIANDFSFAAVALAACVCVFEKKENVWVCRNHRNCNKIHTTSCSILQNFLNKNLKKIVTQAANFNTRTMFVKLVFKV